MGKKSVYIAEKPSVAQEFAKALHLNLKRKDGYLEAGEAIVTWCVGHLVTMSYPEAYDEKYKRWSLQTLPFIPKEYKYEVIPAVKKQFEIVKGVLTREDVERIYVCTDSGREGEYIYRLVEQEAHVEGKERRRVWIDSQTEEEILNRNGNYYFVINNNSFVFRPFYGNNNSIDDIYKLNNYLSNFSYIDKIILNKFNSPITKVKDILYVLILLKGNNNINLSIISNLASIDIPSFLS